MLSKLILKLFGWKLVGNFQGEMKRSVLVIAPHTSNWDFIIGRLVFNVLNLKVNFLIKKEAFKFPLGYFLRKWGGIPVDRQGKNKVVDQVAARFDKHKELIITITPEGTRSYVQQWKKGYYYIAHKAGVPIVLGFLDYNKKEAGLGPVFHSSGDYEKDTKIIADFYKDKVGKHPEKFNSSAMLKNK